MYEVINNKEVKGIALELIIKEEDRKYKKKYVAV
ncbi:hypothetical protein QFZ28_002887 [Neobacillus niacini]|nr:hypothetical protein [Neobacillus niacini]